MGKNEAPHIRLAQTFNFLVAFELTQPYLETLPCLIKLQIWYDLLQTLSSHLAKENAAYFPISSPPVLSPPGDIDTTGLAGRL